VPDQDKNERFAALLAYVTEKGRICPQPQRWNELWELLPNRRQNPNGGWNPPLPLILGAWHYTTGLDKILHLREHIEYAYQNGVFDEIDRFLRRLSESDWHKAGGD
jgi:hypothetical protein